MDEHNEVICQWCQAEIIWDPEIGPEEMCPHCFNELGNYRSLTLGNEDEIDDSLAEESEVIHKTSEINLEDDDWDDEEFDKKNIYSENVQLCLDEQEEAPECLNCRELLLLSGERTVTSNEFVSHVPSILGDAFIPVPFSLNVYICPSCFRIEHVLSQKDRLTMIEQLSKETN